MARHLSWYNSGKLGLSADKTCKITITLRALHRSDEKRVSNSICLGVIHLVRTHKGGRGSSKSVRHAYKGEGDLHVELHTQKRPFLHVFCDIFICWKLLPCFVAIGVDFHYRFIKHFL